MGPFHFSANTINVILAGLVIALGTVASAGWLSPTFLREAAVRFLARAASLDAARAAHPEAMEYWGKRLQREERARLTIVAGVERS